ncbi:MAG: carbonic anhydrase [Gammaproteobacteria bacterium]|nr:carbonic anhydrase [Gammaproteobacteria bacterium]
MRDIADLVAGFQRFRERYFGNERALFDKLIQKGQAPKVMVIACCDARVDPAIVLDCDPGDLFVVRNVANLVPPHETSGHYHGTSAALEFAVTCLQVEHVIVLGHAQCGGIRALLGDIRFEDGAGQFIQPWMTIAREARERVQAQMPSASRESQARACEQAAVRVSLRNLLSFPFVQRRTGAGKLTLHGWYFDLEQGELLRYDAATERFDVLN